MYDTYRTPPYHATRHVPMYVVLTILCRADAELQIEARRQNRVIFRHRRQSNSIVTAASTQPKPSSISNRVARHRAPATNSMSGPRLEANGHRNTDKPKLARAASQKPQAHRRADPAVMRYLFQLAPVKCRSPPSAFRYNAYAVERPLAGIDPCRPTFRASRPIARAALT